LGCAIARSSAIRLVPKNEPSVGFFAGIGSELNGVVLHSSHIVACPIEARGMLVIIVIALVAAGSRGTRQVGGIPIGSASDAANIAAERVVVDKIIRRRGAPVACGVYACTAGDEKADAAASHSTISLEYVPVDNVPYHLALMWLYSNKPKSDNRITSGWKLAEHCAPGKRGNDAE
jgi:hypothetical protein